MWEEELRQGGLWENVGAGAETERAGAVCWELESTVLAVQRAELPLVVMEGRWSGFPLG